MRLSTGFELDINHFLQMEALERKYYDDEHITPAAVAYEWYKKHPHTTVAAEEDGKIVGFVNLFPVTDEVFRELKAGCFNDSGLELCHIANLDSPNLHMFLSCIVVEPQYRSRGITKLLLRAAAAQYESVKDLCDFIITENVTDEGIRFAKRVGFEPTLKKADGSVIQMQEYSDFCRHLSDE